MLRSGGLLPSLDQSFYRDEHLFVDLCQPVVILDCETVRLTPMQYRLLAVLVEHAGVVVPRPTLALWVWGRELGPRSNMLDKHIRGLRRKLGVYADQYLETVIGVGYRFRPRDSAPTSGDIKDVPD
jgi:two-component system phosphate regulon response regulator PhoB